ncbi:orotate phosphoribosyltransferase [Leptolyngbya sp. Heron Island J]|uniref:orotate phosphoribosyltransferase n=1 Tax=Leptolyngbya sp. Heron Island J TaxID=1385935 RepID=UPI0003B9E1CD|nr:orotate phosphoribosyltransferase [Leptolyngbya sp. Heron Island J]ESA34689.1 orotate phosphoribosyltransferase [Leptolyngbya sp. Heron Island J]
MANASSKVPTDSFILTTMVATPPISTDLTSVKQQLLDLICTDAYKEGDFVLSSGQRSNYYINGKLVTLHPQGGQMVGRVMLDYLDNSVVGVGGLTLGADPIVTAVSVVAAYEGRSVTPLIVRKEAKGHGTRAYIEGPSLPDQSNVVILEDVVTTGQSAMTAIIRLREAGYAVNQVISLVDRQQGGAEHYAHENIDFKAVYTISAIQARWQELQTLSS